jgi:hypothetical protein
MPQVEYVMFIAAEFRAWQTGSRQIIVIYNETAREHK